MDDETSAIYGIELQARSLAAVYSPGEHVRFLIGTQSLKCENQLYLVEFDEESNSISKRNFAHDFGEIWDVANLPSSPTIVSTVYNNIGGSAVISRGCLWKLPLEISDCKIDDSFSSGGQDNLEEYASFPAEVNGKQLQYRKIVFNGHSDECIAMTDEELYMFDLHGGGVSTMTNLSMDGKLSGHYMQACRWSPHANSNLVGAACDSAVKGWDIRSSQVAWTIESGHGGQIIRSLDFNPNRTNCLATCGDDCQCRIWDMRQLEQPIWTARNHSHWAWCVRFNPFHDQLLLTSGSDSRVCLQCAISVSSESVQNKTTELTGRKEALADPADDLVADVAVLTDGLLKTCEEHEDSVYCCEWSSVDPWIFASLCYDGRLVVSQVPRNVKYSILMN